MTEQVNAKIQVDERLAEVIQSVEKLVTGLDRFITTTEHVRKATSGAAKAQESIAGATKKAASAMEIFNKSSQDLTKSVQVALGPLSGVAARITAMTSLFNRNSFAAASLIGFITGLGVATKKLVRFAMETEVEMLRMEAVVSSLGKAANFTAPELEYMAQALTKATLASVSDAREAITTLATFGDIAPEVFEKATRAAYAFADVMGGQLAASVRQVGVLLEDPVRNMDMLRRRGIQFTQTEKEKIDILMKSGRVMEAQNLTLEKFKIFMEQSEAKAKLLAGTLDRTAQLFNNFAQKVAMAGNLTGGVSTQMGELNLALEKLLENRAFIEAWGSVFSGIANTVSGSLQVLANNIEIVTVALLALLNIIAVRTGLALVGFAAKLLGAAKYTAAFTAAIVAKKAAVAASLAGLGAFGIALKALLGPLGLVIASIGLAVNTYIKWKKSLKEAEERIAPMKAEIVELDEKLKDLPDNIRISFKVDLEKTLQELDFARLKFKKLEADAAKAQLEIDRGRLARSGRSPGRRLTDEEIEARKELIKQVEEQAKKVGVLEEAAASLRREIELGIQANRAWGIPNVDAAIAEYNRLRDEFFPNEKDAREKGRILDILGSQLQEVIAKSEIGNALAAGGATEEGLRSLIAQVERGKTTATKANDAWKGLANTFEDLEFNIAQVAREISGLETSMQISPSLLRQWNDLTSGDRAKLTSMGRTPEALTALQNAEKEANELLRYRQRILDEELDAREKITVEAEKMLGILERTQGISEEVKNIESARIKAYRDASIQKILDDEKKARLSALRDIEYMYAYMNLTIQEAELSRKDFAIAVLNDELRQKMHAVQEYVNKRVELEGGMNDAIAADAARLREGFMKDYQLRMYKIEEQHDNMIKVAAYAAEAMNTAFAEFLFKPWETGLKGMLTSFVNTLHQMVSQLLAQQILMSFFGAFGGSNAGIGFMSTMFRAVQGNAQGGYISGPGSSTSDSIPARLSNGEYVINARAVRQIGVNALNAINEGRMAKFSQGGYVGQSTDSGHSGVRIINVVDPSLMQDYMNSPAGEKVILNTLRRNSSNIRQLVS